MVNWIEYPSEPRELILVWQAPPSVPDRLRWAVGRLGKVGGEPMFDYLNGEDFADLNLGRSPECLRLAGYSGYPAFDLKKRPDGGFREHVLEAFLRRVPLATRSDFSRYLEHYRIQQTTKLSPLALLAVTEARLPSDGFSLVDPLDPSANCVDLIFEVAGFRYYSAKDERVAEGDMLELEAECANLRDARAVKVTANGHVIGHVNRLQAETLRGWLTCRQVSCWIARVNGRAETPRAYAFLQVRPAKRSIAA